MNTIINFLLFLVIALLAILMYSIFITSKLRQEIIYLKQKLELANCQAIGGVVYQMEDGSIGHDILRRGDQKHIEAFGSKKMVGVKFFINNIEYPIVTNR